MKLVIVIALAAIAAAAVVPRAGSAAGGPDLRIVALVSPPDVAVARTGFSTAVTVRNAGSAAAGRSRVGFFLSRDARRDAGDLPLGERAVGRVRAGSTTSSLGTRLTIPAEAADRTEYFLLYCADVDRQVRESGSRAERNCVASDYTTTVRHLDG